MEPVHCNSLDPLACLPPHVLTDVLCRVPLPKLWLLSLSESFLVSQIASLYFYQSVHMTNYNHDYNKYNHFYDSLNISASKLKKTKIKSAVRNIYNDNAHRSCIDTIRINLLDLLSKPFFYPKFHLFNHITINLNNELLSRIADSITLNNFPPQFNFPNAAHLQIIFKKSSKLLLKKSANNNINQQFDASINVLINNCFPNSSALLSKFTLNSQLSNFDNQLQSNFRNLTYLNLSNNLINDLSDFPLTNFPKLTSLNLSKNRLKTINGLNHLKNLKFLNLSSVNYYNFNSRWLESLIIDNLSELSNLQSLDLSNNGIAEIKNLSSLSNLQYLNLSHNVLIKNIDNLSDLKNLQILKLVNTNISKIENLSNLSNLKILDLSSNLISKLQNLNNLNNLSNLILKNNYISIIDLSQILNLKKLEIIDISKSKISNLEFTPFDYSNHYNTLFPNLKAFYIDSIDNNSLPKTIIKEFKVNNYKSSLNSSPIKLSY
ncbi:leucine-rich repeat domain-containing protein [Ascoidea rubescens DSM 1968]|uniref:L domain-like protein n=1 Tax=Ascoidea rubescens DSM 1968 TaxID=1344418 RepID=A0A1D2V9Q8_9ASCO|nr:L domain-like protein [Ascoidea rubescens DSM 1968]ODV58380.1 L domain-like protein [Ascoidea rubescens DSM 1968]